jgi:polyphosphate glucokinase
MPTSPAWPKSVSAPGATPRASYSSSPWHRPRTALFADGHLMPNTELGHILLDNVFEAERYASEAVRVTKKLKWKEWGKHFNHYLVTMENLPGDLLVLGGGVRKKSTNTLAIHRPRTGRRRQFPQSGRDRRAALFAESQLRQDG